MKRWMVLPVFIAIVLAGCSDSGEESVPAATGESAIETITERFAETESSAMETTESAPPESSADLPAVYIMRTEKGGEPEYITPDPAFQDQLIVMLEDQKNRQVLDSEVLQGNEEYGFGFSYGGYQYEVWDHDIIAARPEAYEDEHFYIENQDLSDLVKDYVRKVSGITAFLPGDIGRVISAELVYKDRESGEVISSERIADKEEVALIEGWMRRAEIINGGTACGFGDCELKLEQADGSVLTLAMAGDSCNMYFVNGRYFQYRDIQDNEPFFRLFEQNPVIRAWRKGYMGPVTEGVVMTVEDGSVTPQSVVLKLYNGTGLDIQFGDGYYLEQMADGEWNRCPYIAGNQAFHDIAYSLETGKPAQIKLDWAWLYGILDKGNYRLVKEIRDFRGTGDYDTYEIAAEFTIP